MSYSVVVQHIDGRNHHCKIPVSSDQLISSLNSLLQGNRTYYSAGDEYKVGFEAVDMDAIFVLVNVENSVTNEKVSFPLILKHTVNENDLINTLMGMNINGVVVDKVYISSQRVFDVGVPF